MKETKTRSIVKALTWRIVAFITLVIAVLILDGNIIKGLELALLDVVIKLFIHYGFERGWNCINWGYIEEIKEVKEQSISENI